MILLKKMSLGILFCLFSFSLSYSQEKMWENDLSTKLGEVGWILQSNDGLVIASGAKGLLAMSNETGEVIWENNDIGFVDKSTYRNVEGLPMFYAEYNSRGLLINSSTGDVLYDTKDSGYSLKEYSIFPKESHLLFEVTKKEKRFLMCFSLKTMKELWVAPLGEYKTLLSKLQNAKFIEHGPYYNNDGNIVFAMNNKIFCLDSQKGDIIWTNETSKQIRSFVLYNKNNSLYVGARRSKKVLVLNSCSGEDITPDKMKLKGTLVAVVKGVDNELILLDSDGFNVIDPETNEFKWKKRIVEMNLTEVIPHENGYYAISKEENKSMIASFSRDREKLWRKGVEGYAYYIKPVDKGLLYISSERANILNYEKGKDVWKKDVKFKAIPAVSYDEDANKVVLFENKKGYKFDLNTGDIELFAEDIKLDHVKKSTPLVSEYIKGVGCLLQTGQHLSLLSSDGKLIYTRYFEPASSITGLASVAQFGLAVAGIDFDIEGAVENIQTLNSFVTGNKGTSVLDQTDGETEESVMAGLYVGEEGNRSTVFEVTKKRYSNSKAIRGHKFIIEKFKSEEGGKQHFINKVNKLTGETEMKIELIDKTPNYLIDEIDEVVFINQQNHLVSAYKF